MTVTYQSIFDMLSIDTLSSNDMFLVARGSRTYYSTYQTAFSTLSGQVYKACEKKAFQLSVISNEDELDTDQTSKAVGGNIGFLFKNRINAISSDAVMRSGNQNISGIKTFSQTPKITSTISGADNDVPNCKYVKTYVDSRLATPVPMFSTAFIDQRLNFTTSTSRLCPYRENSQKFPEQYSIYCVFVQTSATRVKPSFAVSKNGQALTVKRYAGTETISTRTTDTISSSASYSCLVDNSDDVAIKIDNKNASVQVTLSIFAGHDDNPRS